jgi:beta-glucosidase
MKKSLFACAVCPLLAAVLFLFPTDNIFAQVAVPTQTPAGGNLPQLGKDPIDKVIGAMTLEEKAHLVVGMGFRMGPGPARRRDTTAGASRNAAAQGPVIGNTEEKVPGAAGTTFAVPRLGIPSITVSDGPAGVRISPFRNGDSSKSYYATAFPVGTLLASSWDTAVVERVGKAFGNEVREYGIDVLLAPALNIQRNPLGGRNFEYYSEDPLVAGRIAAAMVNGIQSNGVGVSIKHFTANNQETNRNTVNTIASERTLREIYFRAFEITMQHSKPWTVMSSYNRLNGPYTSENYDLITTILRDEWHYKGLVMTDWFGGHDPVAQQKAGNDLLMPGTPQQAKAIVDAVNKGDLDVKVLDRNCERMLRLILESPSFKKYHYSDHPDLTAHATISRSAATEGMVLLRNEGGTLPMKKIKNVAVFGNTSYEIIAGGTGSGDVNKAYTIAMPQGLTDAGYTPDMQLQLSYQAWIAAERVKHPRPRGFSFGAPPVIAEFEPGTDLLAGLSANDDIALITLGRNAGEGADRKVPGDFDLSDGEKRLIHDVANAFHAKGKKVVVVLNIGGVMETASWRDQVDAILLAWQPGEEAGHAIADVLSGKVNPSGKLTASFPLRYADVPSAKNFPGRELPSNGETNQFGGRVVQSEVVYEEGIYTGYRYYTSSKVQTAYPFGYGMSYTSFKYGEPTLSSHAFAGRLTATVTVTNTGAVAGKEVVQLYIHAPAGDIDKPVEELKAFGKTHMLQPGQSQALSFTLTAPDLASFHTATQEWIAEAGAYKVMIGASATDIRASAEFTLAKPIVTEHVHPVLMPQVRIDSFPLGMVAPAPFETVHTQTGLVSGTTNTDGDVHIYKGIPFAAPPVGNLRWKEPQPVASWDGVRKCDAFGASPMQDAPRSFGVYTTEFLIPAQPISEDCLYLNVWTAAGSPTDRRPVIVYIYGGGFGAGGGNVPIYDGEAMAKKGIVFITINYRVGIFGFFSHPELTAESGHNASGNYGLLDQIAALKWVQSNIAGFGGDPTNVTIAGQSAGSMSVNCLVASPLAKGLFRRAIAQSGASFVAGPTFGTPTLKQAEEDGLKADSALHVSSLAELRALSAADLQKVHLAARPIVDGYVLPAPIPDIFAAGKQNDVSLMTGWTEDDGFIMGPVRNAADFKTYVTQQYGARADSVLMLYPAPTDSLARAAQLHMARDMMVGIQNYTWANVQANYNAHRPAPQNNGGFFQQPQAAPRVYVYRFARKMPATGDFVQYGAFHTGEVPYAYDNLKFVNRPFEDVDRKVAAITSAYWANFARTGDPNGEGLPDWPAYTVEGGQTMVLDERPHAAALPDRVALELWLKK